MQTHKTITHCIEGHCAINIFTSISEIEFADCATNDTVRIEGCGPLDIQGAISCYVHNIARDVDAADHIDWLQGLITKVQQSINHIESNKGKKS